MNIKEEKINIIDHFSNLAPVSDGKNQEIYIELLEKGVNIEKENYIEYLMMKKRHYKNMIKYSIIFFNH